MIYGHGIDLVHLTRFLEMDDTRLDKIAKRILTETEYSAFTAIEFTIKRNYVAKIWAAKEAISKAFSTGISGDTVWKNMQIHNNEMGRPIVTLLNALDNQNLICYLSISHDGDYVMASAILEKENVL
jgi:holo-[acyl-carrier protein] synthase